MRLLGITLLATCLCLARPSAAQTIPPFVRDTSRDATGTLVTRDSFAPDIVLTQTYCGGCSRHTSLMIDTAGTYVVISGELYFPTSGNWLIPSVTRRGSELTVDLRAESIGPYEIEHRRISLRLGRYPPGQYHVRAVHHAVADGKVITYKRAARTITLH